MIAQTSDKHDSSLANRARDLLQQEIAFVYSPVFPRLTAAEIGADEPEALYAGETASPTRGDTDPASEMYRSPLLTPEGERHLFKAMNFFRFQANSLRVKLDPEHPSARQIQQIEQCLDEAAAAREKIVAANLRLVSALAHKYSNSLVDYDDLLSEGHVILVNAVDKFDFSRGFRFSTYATHAVQRHFFRLLHRSQRRRQRETMTPNEVLADVLPEREHEPTLDYRVAELLIQRFEDCLDDRERSILLQRFGLTSGPSAETLKSVAENLGLSKERVRQLQIRAIEKLQDLAIQMKLRPEF